MAKIDAVIRCELNPADPVNESCAVIHALTANHPGRERAILSGIKMAIDKRLAELEKGVDTSGEQVR